VTKPASAGSLHISLFIVLTTGLLAYVIATDALPWFRGPAPYPPEWQWPYSPIVEWRKLWPAIAVAAGLLGLIALSVTSAVQRRPRLGEVVLVFGSIALGIALQISLLHLERPGAVKTLVRRTYSNNITSFFQPAVATREQPLRALLLTYPEQLSCFAVHAKVHPPGPVLFFRGLMALFAQNPRLTDRVLALAHRAAKADHLPANHIDLAPDVEAAAVVGPLLLILLGAAVCWPMAVIAKAIGAGPIAAGQIALMWTLSPAASFFAPNIQGAFAFLVVAIAALMCLAPRAPTPLAIALTSVVAGALAGIAAFSSLGLAPPLILVGLLTLIVARSRAAETLVLCALFAAVGFAGVTALWTILGYDPVAGARSILWIHFQDYELPRSYRTWLGFNLLDFTLFIGWPIVAVLAWQARRVVRDLLRNRFTGASLASQAAAAAVGVVILSDVAGSSRGEVGRMWMPLMPIAQIAVLGTLGFAGRSPIVIRGIVGAALLAITFIIRCSWQAYASIR
jgi:hypothetical protein